jgi:UDP-N-acetylglucosamine:LPS N-acetylglucosamine transferase
VLILSAAVGGGHNAAAEGLREELMNSAPEARVTLCNGLGAREGVLRVFLERSTRWQLTHCPAVYSTLYCIGVRWKPGRWLTSRILHRISRRRLASLIATHDPEVVVCTYPGLTAPLALMRLRGELSVPVCALITDLASLHFWAHPGADLHLVSYTESMAEIERIAAGAESRVVRPPLRATHWAARAQAPARLELGLEPDLPLVVISGGGWGVGDLSGALAAALAIEEVQVVVVCGENRKAREALGARHGALARVRILGFSHDMADILAAASVLVHCTGGLTCLEAAAHRCPVIAYGLRAGHIAHNTSAMVRHGLGEHAVDPARLGVLLRKAIGNDPPAASAMVDREHAATAVLGLADRGLAADRGEYSRRALRTSRPEEAMSGSFSSPVWPL